MTHPAPRPPAPRPALRDVRVFDGHQLTEPRTVVIDSGIITPDTHHDGAQVIDAAGMVLLPGLIDAHVHLHGRDTLQQPASHGVTTALDMATWPPQLLACLRQVPDLTDIRSAGTPAIGEGGPHARIPTQILNAASVLPAHYSASPTAERSPLISVPTCSSSTATP